MQERPLSITRGHGPSAQGPWWIFVLSGLLSMGVVVAPDFTLPGIGVAVAGLALVGSFAFPPALLFFVLVTSPFAGLVRNLASFSIAGLPLSLSGLRWIVVAALAVAVPLVTVRHFRLPRHLVPLALFATWMAVRLLTSGDLGLGLNDTLFYGMPFLMAVYAATIGARRPRLARQLELTILASIMIPILVYAALLPTSLMEYTANGPKGIMNPRPVASFLLIGIAVALSWIRYPERRFWRPVGIALACVALGTIVFTASRMAIATAVMMLAVFAIDANNPFRASIRFIPRLLILSAIGISVVMSVPTIRERFFHRVPTSVDDAIETFNVSGRDVMWSTTWNRAIERPVTGWGPGSARPHVALALEWKGLKNPPAEYPPHNEYLQIFHDGGVIGFGLLVWGWAAVLRQTFRSWTWAHNHCQLPAARIHLSCILGVMALLINALIDNTFHYTTITAPLFILIGVAATLDAGPADALAAANVPSEFAPSDGAPGT